MILFNVVLGLLPTLVLGASFALGIEDDRQHRTMFLLIYGLWSLTLAMWNWTRSAPVVWIVVWAVLGAGALAWSAALRRRQ